MRSRLRAFAAAALLAGCSALGPGATPAPTPAPTDPPIVLEDAGMETPLTPGTYVSRLFELPLRLELGHGWFRRDDITERVVTLRRLPEGADSLSIRIGIEFLQCGTDDPVADPNAAAAAALIAAMPALQAQGPDDLKVGERAGLEVRTTGKGGAIPEDATFVNANEFACVLSFDDVPYPQAEAYSFITGDAWSQAILVDVGERTILIRGRTDTPGTEFFDTVRQVLATMSIGDEAGG